MKSITIEEFIEKLQKFAEVYPGVHVGVMKDNMAVDATDVCYVSTLMDKGDGSKKVSEKYILVR